MSKKYKYVFLQINEEKDNNLGMHCWKNVNKFNTCTKLLLKFGYGKNVFKQITKLDRGKNTEYC